MMLPFAPCSSMIVVGQTGSGKTRFVYRLLRHLDTMYGNEPPCEVLYCYGIHQPMFDEMEATIPHLTTMQGLPTRDELKEFTRDRRHRLIVLDDLMHLVVKDAEMELLFTQGCHHRRVSVVFVVQNLFPKGARARTISLNTYYTVLMRDARNVGQVSHLARQMFPGASEVVVGAYADATKTPYGYLVIDASPQADNRYRLRTHVFPGEDVIVYKKEN